MTQSRVRAVYMRGGTSRCLVFHERDLPPAGVERDYILLSALGSPDPYGRQLDGLGGGISSLSKACIIGPTTHPGADVDYTFAQVEVSKPQVDYTGNCGNCSSAVGPFAIEERLIQPVDGETLVRIHNTNTKKLIVARVPVAGGEPAVHGDFELPGVAGTGRAHRPRLHRARRRGYRALLPTGKPRRRHRRHRGLARGRVQSRWSSCARATSASPAPRCPRRWTRTRRSRRGSRRSGSPPQSSWAYPGSAATPKVAVVAAPAEYTALDGTRVTREVPTWSDGRSPWATAIAPSR